MRLLSFTIDDNRFGISTASVVEIVRAVFVTPLPGAPAVVEGLIDLRTARSFPVFDLRRRFGLPPRAVVPSDHFIVVRTAARRAVLHVDHVLDLVDAADDALDPPGRQTGSAPHIAGVATLADGLVLIHDVETFLSAAEAATPRLGAPRARDESVRSDLTDRTRDGARSWPDASYELLQSVLQRRSRTPSSSRSATRRRRDRGESRDGANRRPRPGAIRSARGAGRSGLRRPHGRGHDRGDVLLSRARALHAPATDDRARDRGSRRRGGDSAHGAPDAPRGEEPYSIALALRELRTPATVVGTDVSRARLGAARRGEYRRWSFRGVPETTVERYFTRDGDRYTLAGAVRRDVEFRYLNLASDCYPSMSSGVWGMDVIFCRNVLIYFDAETIARVAKNLFASLAPHGWLLPGATDPPLHDHVDCTVVQTEAGLVYRPARHAGRSTHGPVRCARRRRCRPRRFLHGRQRMYRPAAPPRTRPRRRGSIRHTRAWLVQLPRAPPRHCTKLPRARTTLVTMPAPRSCCCRSRRPSSPPRGISCSSIRALANLGRLD